MSRKLSALQIARQVFRLTGPIKAVTALMIVIGIAAGLAETVSITFLVSLVFLIAPGTGGSPTDYGWLPQYMKASGLEASQSVVILILVGAVVARLLLSLFDAMLISFVGHRVSEDVRNAIYRNILEIPYRDIHRHDRGELIQILATESYLIAVAHKSVVRIGVNIGALIVFGIALVGTAWQIAVVALLAGVIHLSIMKLFNPSYRRLGADTSHTLEQMTRSSWATLQTLKAVRSYGLENEQWRNFVGLSQQVRYLLHRSEKLGYITSTLSEFLIFGVLLTVMVLSGQIGLALPAVLASTVLIYRMQPHLRELNLHLLKLIEVETQVTRIADLLDEDDSRETHRGDRRIADFTKEIEFRNVDYIYPSATRYALKHKNVVIRAGSKTGIVGPSGSGKTTMMNLILGITNPSGGTVLVDGVPLDTISRKDWTKMIAIAGQDVELMEGSVRDNIMFFRQFSEEELVRAAEIAGCDKFIRELPNGYDEWVGDEARKLSGGQRQRLGIARAIIGQQKILLLDEATSALDEETEAAILTRILAAYKDRTVVVITHRKSVIPFLDTVFDLRQTEKRQISENSGS